MAIWPDLAPILQVTIMTILITKFEIDELINKINHLAKLSPNVNPIVHRKPLYNVVRRWIKTLEERKLIAPTKYTKGAY